MSPEQALATIVKEARGRKPDLDEASFKLGVRLTIEGIEHLRDTKTPVEITARVMEALYESVSK